MQKGQAHAKKRRTNPILLLVILALVVFLGVELIRVGKRLNEAAQQQAALERQLQQQTQENQALESDLPRRTTRSSSRTWPATSWGWPRPASEFSTM